MICELCGKSSNLGYRVKLEGSVVSACPACAKLGEVTSQIRLPLKPQTKAKTAPVAAPKIIGETKGAVEYALVEGYGAKMKAARERHGWTQDDLGKKVNETHSLIHRIELEKFEPSVGLARMLESRLGVRLLAPHEEIEMPPAKKDAKDVTLGDLVVIRKRGR